MSHAGALLPLEQYVDDCRRLARDIEAILEDIEYQIHGGEIRYAIDFSEIHAYIDPEPSEAEELKVFPDDDISTCWAIQNAVINLLLFGLNRKPILLPPYVTELEGYLNWSATQPARVLARSLARAFDEASKVRNSDESDEIIEIVNRLRENPDAVADEERSTVFQYVDDNAKNLTVLVQSGQTRPRYALIELLRRRPFDDLSSLSTTAVPLEPSTLPLNEETAERWEKELLQRRPRRAGASYRDAYVMMLLEAVDTKLAKTNTRLCLVTRSPHMHEVYEQELNEKRWKGPPRRLLRHPRSFIASAAGPGNDLQATRKRLQDQHTSILAFLDMMTSLEGVVPEEADSAWTPLYELVREDREKAGVLLETVKRDWRQLISLATAEAGAQGVVSQETTARSPRLDVVLEIFRAVHDPGVLRTHVRDRIGELARTINFHYQYVTALEGRALSSEAVAEDVRASVGADAITIDATYVPYALAFRSPDVVAWSRRMSGKRLVDPDELLGLFEQGFASGRTYEPLLALAYLFAAWDRWSLARDYAALALAAHVDDDPPPVEGYLFKALSLRMSDERSRACYEEAMQLLDEAVAMTDGQDPRVIVEKSVQILYWSFHLSAARAKVKEALELSDRALDMLRGRDDEEAGSLKISVHNNICFYFLHFDDERSRRQAAEARRRLLAIQHSQEPDPTRWRPQILDTELWAEWRLEGQRLHGDERDRLRRRLIERYEDLMRHDMRKSSRAIISRHLRTLQGATAPPA